MTQERFTPDKRRELTQQYGELKPAQLYLGHMALDRLVALCIIDDNTVADQARTAIDNYIEMRQGDPNLPALIEKARQGIADRIIPEA